MTSPGARPAAGDAGDFAAEVETLFAELGADAFGPDSDRALVPYARLLRLRAEHPEGFGEDAAHRLHRLFKWVPGGLLSRPELPLAVLERWQSEAAHRYRLGDHSERAVRQSEFSLARHIGDTVRAERAYAAWLAAPLDAMSDCPACELHEQGSWQARRGDDAEALRIWQPLLDGTDGCPYDPYAVFASALLPLARTGRTEEARAAHLTGYRMLRALPGTRREVAAHVEFCALTGNEPRGLALLAEQSSLDGQSAPDGQAARWEPGDDPGGYLDWTVCVALLMRRLTGLGHPGRPVPGPPGQDWTAVTLLEHAADEALAAATAFDQRNGTTTASDAVRERMTAEPVTGPLPLGLGLAPLDPAARTERTERTETPAPAGGDGPRALLTEARRRSEESHPTARDCWRRAAAAVERDGTRLSGRERAELLDHRAIETTRADPAAGARMFAEAAELFGTAGQPGEAVACQARAALASALAGDTAGALERIGPLCSRALDLHAEGQAGIRQTTAVLLSRARIRADALADPPGTEPDPDASPDRAAAVASTAVASTATAAGVDAELAELIAFAEPHRTEPGVLARIAEATESRGRLAGQTGDPGAAATLLAEAARAYHTAQRPWQAAEAELALGKALLADGAAAQAESELRAALGDWRHDGTLTAAQRARLHLALAEALAAQSRPDEEADSLLAAVLLADGAADGDGTAGAAGKAGAAGAAGADASGDGARLATHARLRLGGAYLALDRWPEAATVLESALPGLLAGPREGDAVQARWWLGQAMSGTGELAAAAGQFLAAAESAARWTDQGDHALLTHLAADALMGAGLTDEAWQAYARAEQLWVPLGDTHAAVRALRSRAWIAIDGLKVPEAIDLMEAALHEVERGMRRADGDDERTALRTELGQTYRQTAELLLHTTDGPPDKDRDEPERYDINRVAYQEAIVFAEHAATAFATCGEAGLDGRAGAELLAAWLEIGLGRPTVAAERAERVLAALPEDAGDPDGALEGRREEAAAVLAEARAGD